MPYTIPEWVEPEVAVTHKGVTVYHTYKADEVGNKLGYWFTTSPETREERDDFDVRDITGWNKKSNAIAMLKTAIDNGWLTSDGLNIP